MKRFLLACLFALFASRVDAAITLTHGTTFNDTTGCNSLSVTSSFTVANNELALVFIAGDATVGIPVVTDDNGGTYSRITTAQATKGSTDTAYSFVRDSLISATSMTVTVDFTASSDPTTGCTIFVLRIAGMTKSGLAAVRQGGAQNSGSGGTAPAPSFGVAPLTTNPIAGMVFNASNPAAMNITSTGTWTEQADVGFTSPNHGAEYETEVSGYTTTSVTWGNTSATGYCAVIVELDASTGSSSTSAGLLQRGVGDL